MNMLRTIATFALMAGLVGGAYWISQPMESGRKAEVSGLSKPANCRPHDDCARMNRTRAQAIQANAGP